MYLRIKLALAAIALSTVAVGQVNFTNSPTDGPFQVRYFANAFASRVGFAPVAGGDSYIDFTNTGANGTSDICVNTYTFAPDEQLVSCCSCRVTRNALWSLSVVNDLLDNTLTRGVISSGVVKLLATQPTGTGQAGCQPDAPGSIVQGMAAWGTTLHSSPAGVALTETPFTNSTLSAQEQAVMTGYCGFIKLNGSGYGICRSCDLTHTAFGTNPASQTVPNNAPEQNQGLGADKQ